MEKKITHVNFILYNLLGLKVYLAVLENPILEKDFEKQPFSSYNTLDFDFLHSSTYIVFQFRKYNDF